MTQVNGKISHTFGLRAVIFLNGQRTQSNLQIHGVPSGANGKELACQCMSHKRQFQLLGWEDPPE